MMKKLPTLPISTLDVGIAAKGIKEWLKSQASFVHFLECDLQDMTGLCCVYSLLCAAVLESYKVPTNIVFADHHVYLTYQKEGVKHILDGTASQFGNVEVCKKELIINKPIRDFELEVPKPHQQYWTAKSMEFLHASAAAVYAIQGGWAPEQCFFSLPAFERAVQDCHQFLVENAYMHEHYPDTEFDFKSLLPQYTS